MARTRIRWATGAVAALLILSGCAGPPSSGEFAFVSPGGQTRIFYDPPESRGRVAKLEGEALLEPGRQIGLADFPDNVVVLNIWGSWCGPCRAEAPHLERVYQQTKDSGVEFLGIDVRDERSAAQDFVRNFGVGYPSIYDPPARSLLALKGYPHSVVPSTIVLDRQHRVAAIFLEPLIESDLLPVVQRVAAEPADSAKAAP